MRLRRAILLSAAAGFVVPVILLAMSAAVETTVPAVVGEVYCGSCDDTLWLESVREHMRKASAGDCYAADKLATHFASMSDDEEAIRWGRVAACCPISAYKESYFRWLTKDEKAMSPGELVEAEVLVEEIRKLNPARAEEYSVILREARDAAAHHRSAK